MFYGGMSSKHLPTMEKNLRYYRAICLNYYYTIFYSNFFPRAFVCSICSIQCWPVYAMLICSMPCEKFNYRYCCQCSIMHSDENNVRPRRQLTFPLKLPIYHLFSCQFLCPERQLHLDIRCAMQQGEHHHHQRLIPQTPYISAANANALEWKIFQQVLGALASTWHHGATSCAPIAHWIHWWWPRHLDTVLTTVDIEIMVVSGYGWYIEELSMICS